MPEHYEITPEDQQLAYDSASPGERQMSEERARQVEAEKHPAWSLDATAEEMKDPERLARVDEADDYRNWGLLQRIKMAVAPNAEVGEPAYENGHAFFWINEFLVKSPQLKEEIYGLVEKVTEARQQVGQYESEKAGNLVVSNIENKDALKGMEIAEIGGALMSLFRPFGAEVTMSNESRPDLLLNTSNYREVFGDQKYDITYSSAVFVGGSGIDYAHRGYFPRVGEERIGEPRRRENLYDLLKVFSAITKPGGLSIHYAGDDSELLEAVKVAEEKSGYAWDEAFDKMHPGKSADETHLAYQSHVLRQEFGFEILDYQENVNPARISERMRRGRIILRKIEQPNET